MLASHDLEIRGAGELLGDEQSGQIHEIGYTLYMELLERAVKALKSGKQPELDQPLDHGPEIDLHFPALLPEDYLPDVHTRLITYKRIASTKTTDELRDLQVEMIDRFGLLPETAKTLIRVTSLKLKASPLGIKKIDIGAAGGRIILGDKPNVNSENIIRLIQSESQHYKLDGQNILRISMDLDDEETRFQTVEKLLETLTPVNAV
jgi:transcription-repair coupling factor (superfamily II helicase)